MQCMYKRTHTHTMLVELLFYVPESGNDDGRRKAILHTLGIAVAIPFIYIQILHKHFVRYCNESDIAYVMCTWICVCSDN